MTVKFTDVFSKADWAKILVLLVFSGVAWFYVWQEYQKPLIDFDDLEIVHAQEPTL